MWNTKILNNLRVNRKYKNLRSKLSRNEYSLKNIVPRVKNYGVLVMVCGCMPQICAENLVFMERTIHKQDYLTILKKILHNRVEKLTLDEYCFFKKSRESLWMAHQIYC